MQAALPPPILQELMDRQQFEVVLQAQAGGRIVARETLKAYRKNVLAKCYGGDVSRWARPGASLAACALARGWCSASFCPPYSACAGLVAPKSGSTGIQALETLVGLSSLLALSAHRPSSTSSRAPIPTHPHTPVVGRKRKLLEKQKEGKKRMRRLGSVDVPQEVFHELMKAGNKS